MGKSAQHDILTYANLTQASPMGDKLVPLVFHKDACTLAPGIPCSCGLTRAVGHVGHQNILDVVRDYARHAEHCASAKDKNGACSCEFNAIFGKPKKK